MQKLALRNRFSGFTLLELLIVLVILVVIMGVVTPLVMTRWKDANVGNTRVQISNVATALELYKQERGEYPYTQADGLLPRVLIGEAPVMAGQFGTPPGMATPGLMTNPDGSMPTTPMPGMQTPGMPPVQPMQGPGMVDPSFGGPMSSADPMMSPTGGSAMPPNLNSEFPGATTSVGTSTMPPVSGAPVMPGAPGAFADPMMNPTGGMTPGSVAAPAPTTGFSTAHGANSKKNYLGQSVYPLDAWNNPFFYEYPTNRTPDGKPAIWSAGPDKKSEKDGLQYMDDDVISWKDELDKLERDPVAKAAFEARQGTQIGGPGGASAFPNMQSPMMPTDPNNMMPPTTMPPTTMPPTTMPPTTMPPTTMPPTTMPPTTMPPTTQPPGFGS